MLVCKINRIAAAAVLLGVFGCVRHSSTPLAEYLAGKQAAAFVFLAPDCPLSQSYTKTLNELREQFRSKGIELYGVFTSAAPQAEEFADKYKLTLPLILDSGFKLADFLGATKTPEVFVVDPAGLTVYKGAVDNWAPELGTRRTVITEHYLSDALQALIDHKDIRVKRTEAIGCFIERTRS